MTMTFSPAPYLAHELSPGRREALQNLASRLGYRFKELSRLNQALIHSSYAGEFPEVGISNERLEFLGDAVLALVISDLLIARYPEASEGELSHRRAALVNTRQLAALAHRLELGAYLLLGRGEEQQSGREKPSLLANAFEAVLGAIYLDGGLPAARRVIGDLFGSRLDLSAAKTEFQDTKTQLQEYTQKHFKKLPQYRVVSEQGPDHAKIFEVEVSLDGRPLARGRGKTKKQAAQAAARLALEQI